MPVTYPDYGVAENDPAWQALRLHEDALWLNTDLSRLNARVANLFTAADQIGVAVVQDSKGIPIGVAPKTPVEGMHVTAPTLDRPTVSDVHIEIETPEGAMPIKMEPASVVVPAVATDKQRFAVLLTAKAAVVNKSKSAIEALKAFGRWSHLDVPLRYVARSFGWLFRKMRWLNPLALLVPFTTKTGQDVIKAIYRGVTAPIRWAAKTVVKGVKWFFGLFGKWGGRVNAKIDQARAWYHHTKASFFNSKVMRNIKGFFDPKGTAMTVVRGIGMSAGVQSFMTGVLGLGSTVSMLAYALLAPAVKKVSKETGLTDKVKGTVKDQQSKAKIEEFVVLNKRNETAQFILSELTADIVGKVGEGVRATSFTASEEGGSEITLVGQGKSVRVQVLPDGTTVTTDLITGEVATEDAPTEGVEGLVSPLFPTAPVDTEPTIPPELRPVTGVNSGKVAQAAAQASSARKAKAAEDRARAEARRAASAVHGPAPKA